MICNKGESGTRGFGGIISGGGPAEYKAPDEEQLQSLYFYQFDAFAPINKDLREKGKVREDLYWSDPEDEELGMMGEDLEGITYDMDNIMQPLPNDTVMYRGMGYHLGERIADTLGKGGIFKDNAFISVSKEARVAQGFRGWTQGKTPEQGKGWLATIKVPAGTSAIDVNRAWKAGGNAGGNPHSEDNEVILARGTQFKVDAVDWDKQEVKLTVVKQ